MNVIFSIVWPVKNLGSEEFEIYLLMELVINIPMIILNHFCVSNKIFSFE